MAARFAGVSRIEGATAFTPMRSGTSSSASATVSAATAALLIEYGTIPAPRRGSSAWRAITLTIRPPRFAARIRRAASRAHRNAERELTASILSRSAPFAPSMGVNAKPPAQWIEAHGAGRSRKKLSTASSSPRSMPSITWARASARSSFAAERTGSCSSAPRSASIPATTPPSSPVAPVTTMCMPWNEVMRSLLLPRWTRTAGFGSEHSRRLRCESGHPCLDDSMQVSSPRFRPLHGLDRPSPAEPRLAPADRARGPRLDLRARGAHVPRGRPAVPDRPRARPGGAMAGPSDLPGGGLHLVSGDSDLAPRGRRSGRQEQRGAHAVLARRERLPRPGRFLVSEAPRAHVDHGGPAVLARGGCGPARVQPDAAHCARRVPVVRRATPRFRRGLDRGRPVVRVRDHAAPGGVQLLAGRVLDVARVPGVPGPALEARGAVGRAARPRAVREAAERRLLPGRAPGARGAARLARRAALRPRSPRPRARSPGAEPPHVRLALGDALRPRPRLRGRAVGARALAPHLLQRPVLVGVVGAADRPEAGLARRLSPDRARAAGPLPRRAPVPGRGPAPRRSVPRAARDLRQVRAVARIELRSALPPDGHRGQRVARRARAREPALLRALPDDRRRTCSLSRAVPGGSGPGFPPPPSPSSSSRSASPVSTTTERRGTSARAT